MDDSIKTESSPYRWVILSIMWLTTFVGVVPQFQISALAYRIIPELNLTAGQFSLILTAPMLPAVIFSLAAGALADRFGVKKVVAVGFIFSIIGVYFRYAANSFLELFILMFLTGISITLLNANAAKLIGSWFPKEQIGTALGLYFTAAGVGITVSLSTSALFPTTKSAYVTAGYIMIAVWIIWMAFIKVKPQGAPDFPVMPVLKYIGVAARSSRLWLVGMALMFIMATNMAFSGFLPNALHEAKGIDPIAAGFMASLFSIGTILGSIFLPFLSDRIGIIKPFLGPVAFLGGVTMYLSWLAPLGLNMVLLVFVGILVGGILPLLLSFPMLLPEIGPVYAGTAGGLIATLQLLGAVFIPSFILAPLSGQNYTLLFMLCSMCFLIMGVISLFLPELGSKSRAKDAVSMVKES